MLALFLYGWKARMEAKSPANFLVKRIIFEGPVNGLIGKLHKAIKKAKRTD